MLNRTREQELCQSKTAPKEMHCILPKIGLQGFLKLLPLKLQLIYLFPMFQTLSIRYFFYSINIFGSFYPNKDLNIEGLFIILYGGMKIMTKGIFCVLVCMLMIVTIVVPVGMTSEKSNPKPLVASSLPIAGSYEQGCFNVSWPSYNKTIRFRFPVKITETCNESHTNVTVNITITNNGPARLCSVPPWIPRLSPGDSRSYLKVIPTFSASSSIILKSSVLFGWGFPHIKITVTVDNCPPVTQTARVRGHLITIP
jgi:hypothetical protein